MTIKTKRALLWGAMVCVAACAIPAGAQGVLAQNSSAVLATLPDAPAGWLITAAEAQTFKGEAGFNEEPSLRPRSVTPVIDILKPEPVADLKVKAPFAIAVEFKGQSDAAIDPSTFKVMYGALKIDITSRITKYVTVSKDGFNLDNAKIPPGKHRLTLQIQDAKQRVAERELRVEVE